MNENPTRLSRFASLNRQLGMSRKNASGRQWLAAVVLMHLAVNLVHGVAHIEAQVPLSKAAGLFVFVVILIGPLVGLALTWPAARIGGWIVAITMSGSLVFGLVNHFVLAGQDHVAHVAAPWRPLFASSAALLAVLELVGCGLAIDFVRKRRSLS
jgi:hypothetical protein